ncbi:MAG: hypothetical protein U0271_25280 [Polyangiaceae bacterium]
MRLWRDIPRLGRFGGSAFALTFVLAFARRAHADPLPTDDYAIDLFQGPLLSPVRVMALGGAYAGLAEDLPGLVSNSAAPAVRKMHALRHVEVDFSGSFSIPIDAFDNNDFDNSGDIDDEYSDFVYATAGVNVQVGAFGAGLLAEAQTYQITSNGSGKTAVVVGKFHALAGYAFVDGQVCVGGGVRGVTMGFDAVDADPIYAGVSPELGILLKPSAIPFRFGATLRFPVVATLVSQEPPARDANQPVSTVGGLVLPRRVIEPWEIETGIAFQIGPRPLNVRFIDPEDVDDRAEAAVRVARRARAAERERILAEAASGEARAAARSELDDREADLRAREDDWITREESWALGRQDDHLAALPRERFLALFSLVATGAVENGVGIEDFLAQSVDGKSGRGVIGTSGAGVNFSPRFGIEVEPVANLLILRAGSYYEPNRFGDIGRQHFTFGAHLRLLSTNFWGLLPEVGYGIEAGLDVAPRYQSLSATISVYR